MLRSTLSYSNPPRARFWLILALICGTLLYAHAPAALAQQGQKPDAAAPSQPKTVRRTTHVTLRPAPTPTPTPAPPPAPAATPTPTPTPVAKVEEKQPDASADDKSRADAAAKEKADKDAAETKRKAEEAERKRAADEAARIAEETRKAEEQERLAARAALEKVRSDAAAEADKKARAEMEKRLADERKENEARLEKEAKERERVEAKAAEERKRLKDEADAREAALRLETEKKEREAKDKAKELADAEAKAALEREAHATAAKEAKEREAALERDRKQAADQLASTQQKQKRADEIIALARELNFRDAAAAVALVPDNATDLRATLAAAAKRDVTLVRPVTKTTGTFCDPEFVGKALIFDFPSEVTTLGDVINYIRVNTDVNFMTDSDIKDLPVEVNVSNVAWNIVLKNLLEYKDLEASCSSGGVLQIVSRSKLAAIQDNRRKTAPLLEEYIALRYLQAAPQVTVNVAGKSSNPSAGAYQTLEETINRLLKESGNAQAQVARVPNRNELFIRAPAETLASIKRLIAKADRESYVVVIRASTYTADDSKLKDLGIQSALTISDAMGLNRGGVSTLPPVTSGSGSTNNTPPAGLNPGNVPGLPGGFRVPSNSLGAVNPATILGGTGLFGTVQFAVQLSALQQRGIVNVQQRPALLVNNGDTGSLDFGRTIAVAVQGTSGTTSIPTGELELLNAGSTLSVTPQVAENENGDPAFVTLDVRLEANDVDTSVATATAPSIIRRAIQTRYVMGNRQTVVFSAFSTDAVTRQNTKTPFFGDLPGVGALFRRKFEDIKRSRTYFTLSVEIVRQSEIINVATPPDDASPSPVPPPDVQSPSPYKKKTDK